MNLKGFNLRIATCITMRCIRHGNRFHQIGGDLKFDFLPLAAQNMWLPIRNQEKSIFFKFDPGLPPVHGVWRHPTVRQIWKMFENFCLQTWSCYTLLESKFTVLSENHNVWVGETHRWPMLLDKHSRGYFEYFCLQ